MSLDIDPDAIGGFVAAEGCFTGTVEPRRFCFRVGLGAVDSRMCEGLRDFFGVGHLVRSARRKPHYDDEIQFAVGSIHDLIGVIIPFMDEHLPESYKRVQYLDWRQRLFEFWGTRARRVRLRMGCEVHGCGRVQCARGLCRRHYYLAFGA